MEDAGCFQLIEQGVAFPPILVKAELLPAGPTHGTPSSSQSARYSGVRFQAIRFLNGKQELVQVDVGGDEDDSNDAFVKAVAGKKGLNKRLSRSECCEEAYDRFKTHQFDREYDNKISIQDLESLDISFDFLSDVKKSPATPAFVLAFEAACSFGKAIQAAEEASSQASKELKQKARELTVAERKASNLSEDLAREKQKFQRLLSSGGSSMEDALAPRGGKGARRNATMLGESMVLTHDPDSPRKKRKAADGVLLKAGRTAQKETNLGFIDSNSDEDEDDKPAASKKSKSDDTKPSSSDTAASSSVESKGNNNKRGNTKSLESAGKQKAKLIEEPTLNAKRSVRTAKQTPISGFVESDTDEDEDDEDTFTAGTKAKKNSGGKSKGKQAASKKKAAASDTETEKTASDSDMATGRKRK